MGSKCDQIKMVTFGEEILAKKIIFFFRIFSQKKNKKVKYWKPRFFFFQLSRPG
jgi:hypothetical protein